MFVITNCLTRVACTGPDMSQSNVDSSDRVVVQAYSLLSLHFYFMTRHVFSSPLSHLRRYVFTKWGLETCRIGYTGVTILLSL